MSTQFNYSLPSAQDAAIQVQINPPTSISGWTLRFDLMYRLGSPNPIISLYLASGYTSGQSGINLYDGSKGIFNASQFGSTISGVNQSVNTLVHQTWRIDSGYVTPIVAGYRLLSPI